jgi:hypothetical protein
MFTSRSLMLILEYLFTMQCDMLKLSGDKDHFYNKAGNIISVIKPTCKTFFSDFFLCAFLFKFSFYLLFYHFYIYLHVATLFGPHPHFRQNMFPCLPRTPQFPGRLCSALFLSDFGEKQT